MTVDLDSWARSFAATLKPQLAAALSRLTEALPRDAIAGLGAYTDADGTSLVAVANSVDHLVAQQDEDPAYRNYYRWSPGEWDLNQVTLLEQGGEDDLAAANAELRRVSDEVSSGNAGDDRPHEFRHLAWAAIVNALGQLLDDGFFNPWPEAIQVFAVMDYDVDRTTLNEWMSEINTDAEAAEFARWIANPSS